MTFHNRRICVSVGLITLGIIAPSCSDSARRASDSAPRSPVASTSQSLTVRAECIGDPGTDGGNAWKCDEERTIECQERASSDAVETLLVNVPGCPMDGLTVDPGPYGLGTHDIEVFARVALQCPEAGQSDGGPVAPDAAVDPPPSDGAADPPSWDAASSPPSSDAGCGASDTSICKARLIIVDTTPPQVESHELELWPPNHELRQFTVADCVTVDDACDANVDVRFLWASADEMPDARGSGNTSPDVQFTDCRTVGLRAERQGGGDGRVYELGYRATDQSGNSVEGTCRVIVPHDQGGHHSATGVAAYQVSAPADCN